jgi:1,4-dihydroxy-2-naphthoate octaprenyltransferase
MIKNWILAFRPQTLLIGFCPLILSFLLLMTARNQPLESSAPVNPQILIIALLIVFFLQSSCNLFNDAIDFEKGADQKRVGPKRLTNNGISLKRIKTVAWTLAALSLLPISYLIADWPMLWPLAALGVYFTYGYTGGKFSLAYNGWGEIVVFLYFGPLSCIGLSFLYTHEFLVESMILGVILGANAAYVLASNNLRDFVTDKLVNKNTLAVKLGRANLIRLINISITIQILLRIYLFYLLSLIIPAIVISIIQVVIFKNFRSQNTESDWEVCFKSSLKFYLIECLILGVSLGYLALS